MYYSVIMGFPGGASGKESACYCRRHTRCGFDSWDGKIPWRRKWQPTSVFLPGKSHGQEAWQATVHGVARVRHDLATKPPNHNMFMVKMGNTEKNKEPLNRTVHNPTTFKYFGSLAGKYTPIHTKEQYIHTYIHTHYREQYWPWDQWRHLFPDFIPRMNLNAMRSIYYVKALSLPQCGLSHMLGSENGYGGYSGHLSLQRMHIQNPSASSSNHRETDLLRQSHAACTV